MPAGRPTKLTPEIQDVICRVIRSGNYRYVAAAFAGISQKTFQTWCNRGKAAKRGKYCGFLRMVLEAETAAEIGQVGTIIKAAKEDAKHAEWWLERKFPERWGRKDRLKVSGDPDGQPIEHTVRQAIENAAELRKDEDYLDWLSARRERDASERLRVLREQGRVGAGEASQADRQGGSGSHNGNGSTTRSD